MENSSEVVSIVDPDGTLRYASPAWKRMLGYDPEEVVGTHVLDQIHPDDLPRVLEATEDALAQPGVVTNKVEYRRKHKDGSWRWVESVGTFLLGDPAVKGVVVQTRDVTGRKQAEERLKETELRLSNLLSSTPAMVYRCLNEPDWPEEYVSEYALELTGYPAAAFMENPTLFGSLITERDKQRIWDEVQEAVGTGERFRLHYAIHHRDGSLRFVEELGQGVYDESGGVVAVEGLIYDITDRRRVEERLREAEERYRTLVEHIPAVTYVQQATTSGAVTYVSPQMKDLLGYEPEECTSDPEHWLKIIHPEDRERVLAEERRVNETGEPFSMEYRQFAKNGRLVWVRDEATLVRDDGGEPLYWLGVQTDVTEHKRTEAALRESEERFRRSFDDAATGMALVAPEGRWLQVNRSLCEILGYSEGELLGKTFQDITHPDDLDAGLDQWRSMLAGEMRTYQAEKCYLHKDGHTVWALLSVSLVHNEEGEPLYFVSQIQDVSERKKAGEALRETEERYRTLVEQIPAVTYVDPVDDPDNSLYTSPQIEQMLGYTPEEWRNEKLWPKRLHPDDRGRVLAVDERFEWGGGERFDEEYRLLAKDGSVVWVHEKAVLVRDGEGKPLYWQGIMHDVTDRREAEEALRRSEERYRNVVEEQTELVCRFSPDLILTFVNGAFCRYFGKRPQELVGASFMDRVHEADRGYYEEGLVRLNPESPTATVEERVLAPGGVRWLQWTDTAIFDAEGRTVEYQSVGRDVTERKTMQERLQSQALHDSLTGLPNRRLFVDRLGQALRRTRRETNLVAVLFMDLDGFKVVNDSLGHEAGDLLLTVVAQRLGRCLRPEDTLARFGGDEFVVLLEGVEDPGEAVRVAERVVFELRRPFVLEGRELYATASIGVSWGDARTKTPEDLLRDADTAMYQAKRDRSGYRVFDPGMYERAVRRLELENDLRRAVEEGEFAVHYQPIFDFASQEPWGVEALVRWDHPEMGMLGPSEFVPLAEETGLIVPIGAWVLDEACRQTREWQESHPRNTPLGVIVNLSAKQLRHPGCEQTIKRALARSGLAAGSLSLDVTESAFIDAVEANAQALERIQALGVRISIDDFGMGYSSLSYLKRLPADALKIDKSFVKGFGKDAEDTAIVRMVIDVAHTLGLQVVAEGVETWAQATLLAETGCDMAQGYHFAEPLPPEVAAQFLNSTHQGSAQRDDPDSLSDS